MGAAHECDEEYEAGDLRGPLVRDHPWQAGEDEVARATHRYSDHAKKNTKHVPALLF